MDKNKTVDLFLLVFQFQKWFDCATIIVYANVHFFIDLSIKFIRK
jgi:hypothetical protein